MKNIYLKTDEEIELMRQSNILLGKTLGIIAEHIQPGVSTASLDQLAHDYIIDNGGYPSCLNYQGYPYSICTSVNEQVVHGMPSDKVILKNGDIISVDLCVLLNGFHADSAYTFTVGEVDSNILQLLKCTKECLMLGVEQAVSGKRLGDIGYTIQKHAQDAGFSVIRDFVGHGIGKQMHEAPEVCNYGTRGSGPILKNGMTLAIEPMICMGKYDVKIADDGWTASTIDMKPAAHYELSVCVRNGKPDILSTFDYVKNVLGDKFI